MDAAGGGRRGAAARLSLVALTAFVTLVDLFAAQPLLPLLAARYHVTAGLIGLAANASSLGMAAAGIGVALFGRGLDRRAGIFVSLGLLAIPTVLLAFAPNLWAFAALRVVQGLCMSTAFSLMLTYLGEHSRPEEAAGAFAAYVTGNVASNLVGRLIAASLAATVGINAAFFTFAAMNLAGAALVWTTVEAAPRMPMTRERPPSPFALLTGPAGPALLAAFGVGFCILFVFLGVFTYVNFVLVRPPLGLAMMAVGAVYFVFLPSMVMTPLTGRFVARFGVRPTLWGALAVAGAGLPMMVAPVLPVVLAGMVLVGVGTFMAQAAATGFVGAAAPDDRAVASGGYLGSYFLGGLVGAAVLGQVFDRLGWGPMIAGVAVALALAALLGVRLRLKA